MKLLLTCCFLAAKFLSISFVRQIRLPRKAGEANLPPELLATHLVFTGRRDMIVAATYLSDRGTK